jgi:hypothetical protein
MPDLQTLQRTFTTAVLDGNFAPLAGHIVAGRADAQRRLSIFRNNAFLSLTKALRTTFSVTEQLAGAKFFDYATHHFIAAHPPSEARLSVYGDMFPRFLAGFPPCRQHPIIAAMAALEWAVAQSLNAAEERPAPASLLQRMHEIGGAARLGLQPSLSFTVSRWPVLGVWADHKRQAFDNLAPVARSAERIAVIRLDGDIQLLPLGAGRFTFWRSLSRGLTIEESARRALLRDPLFDLVSETLLLFRMRLVTRLDALQTSPTQEGI